MIGQVEEVALAATEGHVKKNIRVCGHGAWHMEAITHGQSRLIVRARPSIQEWGVLSGSLWMDVYSLVMVIFECACHQFRPPHPQRLSGGDVAETVMCHSMNEGKTVSLGSFITVVLGSSGTLVLN